MPDLNLKVSAIDKLLDYTASGIGAVAGPIFLPWKAFWEGKAKRISAHTDADVLRLQAESEAGTSPIIAKARFEAREDLITPDAEIRGTVEITREDITQRIEYQEQKRHANIKAAVGEAANGLSDKEVLDHEPDPDWTARFFDCVQDVSSEDMQRIWAKILAGEVESPGRTSLRTLDTLRNMTKTDAAMFSDLCNFVLSRGRHVVFHETQYIEQYNALRHVNLVHLQDCGLLHFGQSSYNLTDETEQIVYQDILLQVTRNIESIERIPFQVATLTIAGAELYRITEPQLRMDYLRSFAKFLHSKNCQLSYARIINRRPNGNVEYRKSFTTIEPGSDGINGVSS